MFNFKLVAMYAKARTYFERKSWAVQAQPQRLRAHAPALPTRKILWIIFLKFLPPIFLFF